MSIDTALTDPAAKADFLRVEGLGKTYVPGAKDLPRASILRNSSMFTFDRPLQSTYETSFCNRANRKSRNMPDTPITRMAKITLVIDRLFHSFQTK